MAKAGDLLHKALRTADRQGNPLEVMVGVDGGVVQIPAAQMVMNSQVLTGHLRVGGRLLSSTDDGPTVDLGATWFWPNEPLVQSLADELGVDTFPQELAGDAMFEADHRGPRRIEGNPIDVYSVRFAHGAQALALRLADRLPPGVLHLSDPVSRVVVDDHGVRVESARGRDHSWSGHRRAAASVGGRSDHFRAGPAVRGAQRCGEHRGVDGRRREGCRRVRNGVLADRRAGRRRDQLRRPLPRGARPQRAGRQSCCAVRIRRRSLVSTELRPSRSAKRSPASSVACSARPPRLPASM